MPYYVGGDYYGRGDYYRGDPGLFKFLGKAIGGIAKLGGALLPGPLGTVARVAGTLLAGRPPAAPGMAMTLAQAPRTKIGLLPPTYETFFPPAGAGFGPAPGGRGFGPMGLKRRRINPMNVKALRRASRRIDGFARVARKALRHTPFVLVSRASRGGRGGSPGTITRAEAARALKR